MGEGTLAEARGEFEKRVNVSEFISVRTKTRCAETGRSQRKKMID
jgi:hypothetical protein